MSFFEYILARNIAKTIDTTNKEKQKNKKWNELFNEISLCEREFNDFLKSIGSPAIYVFDVECVNNENIIPEKRKIDNYRNQIYKYLDFGGDGSLIYNLDNLNDYIEKVIFLKERECLHRQREFVHENMYTIKSLLEKEEELQHIEEQIKKNKINAVIVEDINLLSGVEFEDVCEDLLIKMGFKTERTGKSHDGGIDIIAYNNQPLFSGKYIIQCKRYSGSVGTSIIRDLYGVVTAESANKGILITTGYFTNDAISFATEKPIELIDGDRLQDLLMEYCNHVTNSSHIVSEKVELEVNMQDFLGYDYDEFKELTELLNLNIDTLHTTCKLIELLYNSISGKILKTEVTDVSLDDIRAGIAILEGYLTNLIDEQNKSSSSKKIRCVYYLATIISAQCNFWKGNFGSSILLYNEVVQDWKELDDDDELFKVDLIATVLAIYNILGMHKDIDIYYDKYNNLIKSKIEFYNRHNWEMGKILQDAHNIRRIAVLDLIYMDDLLSEINNNTSVLYDKSIDEWGNLDISHGQHQFELDFTNDCLKYGGIYSIYNSTPEKTPIIDNLSVKILEEKAKLDELI